ncbi:MAG TPA: serpin family protein [Clostridia bacterium]|nr:serpin family protein [Clostridia bacterium]
MKRIFLAGVLLFSLLFSSCVSHNPPNSSNLMDNVQKSDLAPIEISDPENQQANKKVEITDFALNLFRECYEGKNILISPLSIVSALGMTGNGANNETLTEMEDVLQSDISDLNNYLKAYTAYCIPSNEGAKVNLTNSIWFKNDEDLTVNKDFLQTNKDYYNADIYKAPFDAGTKNDINNWVKRETKGMIKDLLKESPSEDTIMYLINALSFDAEWENIYKNTQIRSGEFTLESGEIQTAEFMSSDEYSYLENELATGFIKPYKDNKYAFVALLPKDNTSMSDLLESLDGKSVMGLLENKMNERVYTKTPKYSVEYGTLLNEPLVRLGMSDAFNRERADFARLGTYTNENIFISRVIHKTKIDLDERGTKAGAVTAVEMECTSGMVDEPKRVILDRPFFYMIVDTNQNLPLFMGSLMGLD